MSDAHKLGKMIRFHRKIARLSQTELAKLSGVGKTVIFDIEQGKETVRLLTLMKILNVLNIKIKFSSPLMNLFEKEWNEKS
ncbi:MAG: helix-turn-helix domain-containing protein [Chlamydiota bacterium]